MGQFFSQYKVYIITVSAVLLFLGIITVVVISINNSTEPPVVQEPADPNQLDYGFIADDQLSNEDKYLMLEAKIMVEQYGTYSAADPRGLWAVKNQSTPEFAAKVDVLASTSPMPNLETTVNPESIQIQRTDRGVLIQLLAMQKNLTSNQSKEITYVVSFIKSGDYWLINDISEQ